MLQNGHLQRERQWMTPAHPFCPRFARLHLVSLHLKMALLGTCRCRLRLVWPEANVHSLKAQGTIVLPLPTWHAQDKGAERAFLLCAASHTVVKRWEGHRQQQGETIHVSHFFPRHTPIAANHVGE